MRSKSYLKRFLGVLMITLISVTILGVNNKIEAQSVNNDKEERGFDGAYKVKAPYGISVTEKSIKDVKYANYMLSGNSTANVNNNTISRALDTAISVELGAQDVFSARIDYDTIDNNTKLVTITANKEMQEIPGWTLSSDKKTMTKEYKENTTEEVIIKDYQGNQLQGTVTVKGLGERTKLLVNYNTKLSEDKKSCVATIVANKELQEINGWNLSADKKTLTKTYTENGDYDVLVKDLDGIELKVTFNITDIGKINFQVTVQKFLATDKKDCTVIIASNRELQEIPNWELSEDKKKLTKVFTQNGVENLTLKDLEGNEKSVSVFVDEIRKEENNNNSENQSQKGIASQNYDIYNNMIRNVQPNTKYEDFKKNITAEKEYEVTENGKAIADSDIMKTGQKLTVDGATYTVIVDGDTNGDGQADMEDINNINNCRFNKIQLNDESLFAADVNRDNKVDVEDIFNINKFRLGRIKSLNERIIDKAYASINISGSNSEVKVGDTFDVTVSTKCNDGINGIASEFSYDDSMLELISVKAVDKFIYLNEGSKTSVEVINKESTITDSDIYTLTFRVKDSAVVGQTTKINIGRIAVNSDNAGETVGEGKPISVTIKAGKNNNNQNNNNQNNNNQNNNNQNNNNQNNNNQNNNNQSNNNQSNNNQSNNNQSSNNQSNNNQSNNNQSSNNQSSNNQSSNNQSSNNQSSNNQSSNNQSSNNQSSNNQSSNNQSSNNQSSNNQSSNNQSSNNQSSDNQSSNNQSSSNQNSNNATSNNDVNKSDTNNISKDKQDNGQEPISSKKSDDDVTTASGSKIPQTGDNSVIVASVCALFTIAAVFFYKKMKRVDNI